jgi:hypothetical protein
MLELVLKATFGVFLVTLASFGIGGWISQTFAYGFGRLDKLAIGLLGGFGLLSFVLFLIGQFSFTRGTIMTVLGLVVVVSAKPLVGLGEHTAILVQTLRNAPKIPLFLLVLIISFTAVVGLGEVTGDWNSDTVAYHLLGPKVWLRNRVIRPVPDNCHTAFPQTAETMYGALLGIGGPRAPKFFSFVTFGMLLLSAASLGMRSGLSSRETWWVAALIATMPAVYNGSVDCFVDGIYAAFVLAAIRIGIDAKESRDWAMFGIFCGLAMGTKYTGILAFPVLILCVVWIRARLDETPSLRDTSKGAVVAICLACIVASPYYLRNWTLLGCPIYPPPPGFAHICSPRYLTPDVVAEFHAYIRHRGEGLGRGITAFILLPFNLTYHTANFHGAGGIGLVPLALAPIGLIVNRKNPIIKMLALLGLQLLLVWFITQQESRFLIHVYIITSIMGVLAWGYFSSSRSALSRALVATVVLASVTYGVFMISKQWPDGVRVVISSAYAQENRNRNIPFLESFRYLNTSADVTRVLILDRSVTPFYLDKDYVKPVGQWGERTLPGGIPSLEALEKSRQFSISHILDVRSEVSPFQINGHIQGLTLVLDSKNQRVYKVN